MFTGVRFPFSQSDANGLRRESDGMSPTELPLDTEAVAKSGSAPVLSGMLVAPWGFGSGNHDGFKFASKPGLCDPFIPESVLVT
jgi:hypothetical protein